MAARKEARPEGWGDPLRRVQAALAEQLVERHFAAHPELAQRHGELGRQRCLADANVHFAYLANAMDVRAPALFTSYVSWAKVMLGKRGIPCADLATHLELAGVIVAENLAGEPGATAVSYLTSAVQRLRSLPTELPTHLPEGAPHVELARAYLRALLGGERHLASQIILDAVSSGVPVREIYLHVFQPTQYEVGRRWLLNEVTIGQEHYCTAATQLIISQLYPHIFASEKGTGTLVAASVSGDLHELGVRMVTDFFEMDGWDTYYLGASTPPRDVVDTIVTRGADVLAISVTISFHLVAVKELIEMVRGRPECAHVKIMVGGYPFIVDPELWSRLGADGSALNAQDAIALAKRWLEDATQ